MTARLTRPITFPPVPTGEYAVLISEIESSTREVKIKDETSGQFVTKTDDAGNPVLQDRWQFKLTILAPEQYEDRWLYTWANDVLSKNSHLWKQIAVPLFGLPFIQEHGLRVPLMEGLVCKAHVTVGPNSAGELRNEVNLLETAPVAFRDRGLVTIEEIKTTMLKLETAEQASPEPQPEAVVEATI